ncbi:hypothetical protein LCGC14_0734550 [marine sediment metagenome]|uniref:Uncharacterized protein n=1 Tax=marine sediment metagenome TaxID=412755 RepID=A0A0F9QCN7_9ZZZZ
MAEQQSNVDLWEPVFDMAIKMFEGRRKNPTFREQIRWLLAYCRKSMLPAERRYFRYYGLLKKLHRLFDQGAGESDEAEAIREPMVELWEMMTPEEEDLARALSVRLKREARGADG